MTDVSRGRIWLSYLWRHRRAPRLANPRRFTELVQRRKMVCRDPLFPLLSDKIAVKPWVADRIGNAMVTPTLWQDDALPATPPAPLPFVVKARHGCRQNAFVTTDDPADWERLRRRTARWMRRGYGRWTDEWGYRGITRGLLIEPYLGGANGALPVDYKLYVFDGRARFVQVHSGRQAAGAGSRWRLFDTDWRPMSTAAKADDSHARPVSFARMVDLAETLGAGFDFVRVDCYDIAGEARFGEMSFYPGAGFDRFDPDALDLELGRLWLAAGGR